MNRVAHRLESPMMGIIRLPSNIEKPEIMSARVTVELSRITAPLREELEASLSA